MRIVIVEDEAAIREGMINLIEEKTEHMVIGEAADGKSGLEKILRLKPDLIITDIRMPGMDGLEMIEILKEAGYTGHIVILSGYSEFEYARKAISYGVEEYLLKPLTAPKVLETLERINQSVYEEWKLSNGSPGSYLSELMNHGGAVQEYDEVFLNEIFHFDSKRGGILITAYTGAVQKEYLQTVTETLTELQELSEKNCLCGCFHGSTRMYYCFLSGSGKMEPYLEIIYKRLMRRWEGKPVHPLWAFEAIDCTERLEEAGDIVRARISLGITAPGMVGWYTKEWETKQIWEEHVVPVNLLQDLKSSIYGNDHEQTEREIENILKYYKKHMFRGQEVRQGILKMYYTVLDVLQEINKEMYNRLQATDILTQLNSAVLWNEIEMTCLEMNKILMTVPREKKENIRNYTIRRALAYIDEHYKEKISQEDVAGYLEITPEYLSMLFNREMKKSFTAYIRKIRMDQAKRLLAGTELKIYEVACQVGYQDARYFNRVFKEETGLSPGDFRQL